MSWQRDLQKQLDGLADPSSAGSRHWNVHGPDWEAEGEVADVDRLGCSLDWLKVTRHKEDDDVGEAAGRLTDRIRYLQEPLKVLEHDQPDGTTQIRSYPPTRSADGIDYYEVLAGSKERHLQRYRKCEDEERQPIPTTVTRDTLERLVNDLAE